MKQISLLTGLILSVFSGTSAFSESKGSQSAFHKSKGYYPTGEVQYIYRYVNGKREGATKEYYKSGKLKGYFKYDNNQLVDGAGFFESGELKYKYKYKYGKRNGFTYEFNREKQVVKKWLYKDGKLQKN